MNKVILQRAWADSRATLGMLSVEGMKHDPIFTLENPLRETSTDSRIPAGEYLCIAYSGAKHKNVYLVRDVPGRTTILIHAGNFEKDTEGCILLGLGAGIVSGEPAVTASMTALQDFRNLLGREDFKLIIKE
jgi:hypothetical protein